MITTRVLLTGLIPIRGRRQSLQGEAEKHQSEGGSLHSDSMQVSSKSTVFARLAARKRRLRGNQSSGGVSAALPWFFPEPFAARLEMTSAHRAYTQTHTLSHPLCSIPLISRAPAVPRCQFPHRIPPHRHHRRHRHRRHRRYRNLDRSVPVMKSLKKLLAEHQISSTCFNLFCILLCHVPLQIKEAGPFSVPFFLTQQFTIVLNYCLFSCWISVVKKRSMMN